MCFYTLSYYFSIVIVIFRVPVKQKNFIYKSNVAALVNRRHLIMSFLLQNFGFTYAKGPIHMESRFTRREKFEDLFVFIDFDRYTYCAQPISTGTDGAILTPNYHTMTLFGRHNKTLFLRSRSLLSLRLCTLL